MVTFVGIYKVILPARHSNKTQGIPLYMVYFQNLNRKDIQENNHSLWWQVFYFQSARELGSTEEAKQRYRLH